MIQMVICAIMMVVVYLVIQYLHNRDNLQKGETSLRYVIKTPSAPAAAYSVMFRIGIALFVIFVFFYLIGIESVTISLLIFALAFAGIGLLVIICSSLWRITVEDGKITIHKLLRKEKSLYIKDVDARLQEKKTKTGDSGTGRIVLLQNGKKLAAVNESCENYDQFKGTLINAGKLPSSFTSRHGS